VLEQWCQEIKLMSREPQRWRRTAHACHYHFLLYSFQHFTPSHPEASMFQTVSIGATQGKKLGWGIQSSNNLVKSGSRMSAKFIHCTWEGFPCTVIFGDFSRGDSSKLVFSQTYLTSVFIEHILLLQNSIQEILDQIVFKI
jgi:hypothetical protein